MELVKLIWKVENLIRLLSILIFLWKRKPIIRSFWYKEVGFILNSILIRKESRILVMLSQPIRKILLSTIGEVWPFIKIGIIWQPSKIFRSHFCINQEGIFRQISTIILVSRSQIWNSLIWHSNLFPKPLKLIQLLDISMREQNVKFCWIWTKKLWVIWMRWLSSNLRMPLPISEEALHIRLWRSMMRLLRILWRQESYLLMTLDWSLTRSKFTRPSIGNCAKLAKKNDYSFIFALK